MLAVRCKLRWPGAVATVGTHLARASVTGPRPHLSTLARARWLGTTASPGRGRHGDKKDKRELQFPYTPRAYEPESPSYAEILSRALTDPLLRCKHSLKQIQRALPPAQRSRADEASAEPADSSPPLQDVLDRHLFYFTCHAERIESVLPAISQDASRHPLPDVYASGDPVEVRRAHHLGRWYAHTRGLVFERRRIYEYLRTVAGRTNRARGFVNFVHINSVKEKMRLHRAAVRQALLQHQKQFEAFVYTKICELKVARQARQWHKVWTLERKLASTASLLLRGTRPSKLPPLFAEKGGVAGMTEISMSRMAEWDDSHVSLYEQDVRTRESMDPAKRYWEIYSSNVQNSRVFPKDPVVFSVKSPVRGREIIFLRQDQSSPPSPLWPRDWAMTELTETEATAESNPINITSVQATGDQDASKDTTEKNA